MSWNLRPPMISKGTRCSADGARLDSSTTTFTLSVSSTAHVNVSWSSSPTRTALRSVFHQHSIGATATSFAEAAAGCCAHATLLSRIMTRENIKGLIACGSPGADSGLQTSGASLSQPPDRYELQQRRQRLVRVDVQAQHIEPRRVRHRFHLVLPVTDARRHRAQLAAGDEAR